VKKWKRISIKNPRLRLVRNALRRLIVLEVLRQQKEISEKKEELWELRKESSSSEYDRINKTISNLSDQYDELDRELRKSVVECAICHSSDRDVEYLPKLGKWTCVWCARFYF